MAKSVGNVDTQGLTFEKVWAMFQETDRKFQETDRKFQETDRKIKELSKNVGGINKAIGDLVESLVQGGLQTALEKETGIKIHAIKDNFYTKGEAEIDCVLVGREAKTKKQVVFICECKSNLDQDDVILFFGKMHQKLKALQKSNLSIQPSDKIIYVFGFSKIDSKTKSEIEIYKQQNKEILLAKVGGDGSVKLIK